MPNSRMPSIGAFQAGPVNSQGPVLPCFLAQDLSEVLGGTLRECQELRDRLQDSVPDILDRAPGLKLERHIFGDSVTFLSSHRARRAFGARGMPS